jgi:hypothetical protein
MKWSKQSFWGGIGVLLVGLGAGIALLAPTPTPALTRLIIMPQLGGVLEPCGCNQNPLGGVDRLAGLVEREQAQAAVGLLFLGDTFWGHPDYEKEYSSQPTRLSRRVQWLMRSLADYPVLGWYPQARDRILKPEQVGKPWSQARWELGIDSATASIGGLRGLAAEVLQVGGVRIGVLIVEDDLSNALIPQASENLRRVRGVDVVMLFSPQLPTLAKRQAWAPWVDFSVHLQEHEPWSSEIWEDEHLPPLLIGGRWGESVLEVTFRQKEAAAAPATTGGWVYRGTGKAQARDLTQRIEQLKTQIRGLPEGTARTLREKRLREYEQALSLSGIDGHTTPLPPGAFQADVVVLDQNIPVSPSVKAKIAQFHQQQCQEIDWPCTAEAPERATYMGVQACQACHEDAWQTYQKTAHAHAWSTLVQAHKQCDASCVGCHVVGFGQPGGFCRESTHAALVHVGCESCHGPGGEHIRSGGHANKLLHPRPGAEVCQGCHTPEHSQAFRFEDYLPRILGPGHQQKNSTAKAAAQNGQ